MSEHVNKAKELDFVIVEAEAEQEDDAEESDKDEKKEECYYIHLIYLSTELVDNNSSTHRASEQC